MKSIPSSPIKIRSTSGCALGDQDIDGLGIVDPVAGLEDVLPEELRVVVPGRSRRSLPGRTGCSIPPGPATLEMTMMSRPALAAARAAAAPAIPQPMIKTSARSRFVVHGHRYSSLRFDLEAEVDRPGRNGSIFPRR